MNPLHNPFSPGAGAPPPELADRKDLLQQALMGLARIKRGRSEKNLLIIGLRGTGKTVLINEIAVLAEKENYQVAMVQAHEKKSLLEMLLPQLRRILFALDAGEFLSSKVKRAFRVLKSFVSNVKGTLKLSEIDFGLGIEPEKGAADSGVLEADFAQLIVAIGEAAKDRQTAIAIMVDDMQYLNEIEFSSLIMAAHKVSQKSLPIIIIGAGLPQLVGYAGRTKSYAERLFDFPELG